MAKPEDWPEDSKHENGKYYCQCHKCGSMFVGHKRRVLCKVCHEEFVISRLPLRVQEFASGTAE